MPIEVDKRFRDLATKHTILYCYTIRLCSLPRYTILLLSTHTRNRTGEESRGEEGEDGCQSRQSQGQSQGITEEQGQLSLGFSVFWGGVRRLGFRASWV